MRIILTLCSALLCAACDRSDAVDPAKAIPDAAGAGLAAAPPPFALPYDLARPSLEIDLPAGLKEISGLAFAGPGLLACVQDERAAIYHLALPAGEVAGEFEFGKDGDFEGVEILSNTAWALENDGDLYEIRDYARTDSSVEKHENALGKDNNVEGLGFDEGGQRLLLACKDDPGEDGQFQGTRSIYAFDLRTKALGAAPLYSIPIDEAAGGGQGRSFHPSGVAVHPVTGEVYVIASKGNRLVVLAPGGELNASVKLPEKDFRQPEGICFSPSGDLFISNEGDGGKATVLQFTYLGR